MADRPRRALVVLTFFIASAGCPSTPSTLMDEMFQDHVVLQRDRPINVWGEAPANEEVTIAFNGNETRVRSDAAGRWLAELPATAAGGPFQLTASTGAGRSQTIADVMVGDVWLCSGQSNMEWPVNRAMGPPNEVSSAGNKSMHLLTVTRDTSLSPLQQFATPVRWQPATLENVAGFSAVCFHFARELQKHVQVPMGLIHASWGGTKIEPWMSDAALRAAGGYDSMLEILALRDKQPAVANQRWAQVWEAWWRTRVPNEQPWRSAGKAPQEWTVAPAGLGHWDAWGVPALAQLDGMVWLRTTVELTAKQAAQGGIVALGKIDDVDMSWVNGEVVGSTSGPDTIRRYPVREGLLKAGTNTIVINALDLWARGGMFGDPSDRHLQLQDGTTIALDGSWEYRIVPEEVGDPPRAPWDDTAGLTLLSNAMIAPLGNFRMRGVAWYQGESNTGEADRYQGLLEEWMEDWRGRFGAELSFLIVQLANFGAPPTEPTESGWAGVREAQRRAVANDDNAGLAVAIDLGDRVDIHPTNKQQVGYRLARAARHVIYGESITPSGPIPVAAQRDGNEVVVQFTDVEKHLVAYSSANPTGFELCTNDTGSCRYALATLDGNSVRLSSSEVNAPTRVRFCWADSPVCTLYDTSGLPAGPFEIGIR